MKLTHLILIGSMFLGACTQEYEDYLQVPETNARVSENVSIIENYLSKTHRGLTRGENYTLIPWIVEGDTTMYIANFPEGGFEIFSNTQALPMVLVKSKEGSFYPNEILNPSPFYDYMEMASQNIHNVMEINPDIEVTEQNADWKLYESARNALSALSVNGRVRKMVGFARDPEIHLEVTPKGGRLKTKWGQKQGYNLYVPYLANQSYSHCYVGCAGVAIGQYLFHTHQNFNIPTTAPSKAYYSKENNTFSFDTPSSTIWQDIENENKLAPTYPKDATSIFLGNIAKCIETLFLTYSDLPSITNISNTIPYLNSQTSQNLKKEDFSFTKVCNILENGYPVFAGSSPENSSGHIYIIDYAKWDYYRYYRIFAYVDADRIDDADDQEAEDDYLPSIEEYREMYGEIEVEQFSSSDESWISVNWGDYGNYNDLIINVNLSTWTIEKEDKTLIWNKHVIAY